MFYLNEKKVWSGFHQLFRAPLPKNIPVSETDNRNQQTSVRWKTYETMYEEQPDKSVQVDYNDAPEAVPAGIGLIEGFAKLIIQPEAAEGESREWEQAYQAQGNTV